MGGAEPWEPFARDPESFERAALAALERKLTGAQFAAVMLEPTRRELRGVRLDGSYPDTTFVVSFLVVDTGTVEDRRFPVWKDRDRVFGIDETGVAPTDLADEVWILLVP